VTTWLSRLRDLLDADDPQCFDAALAAIGAKSEEFANSDRFLTQRDLDKVLLSVRRHHPDITLRLYARAELLDLGLVGYAAVNSDNIGAAIKVLSQYHSLASDRYTDELSVVGDYARICPVPLPMHADDYQNICEDSFSGNWKALKMLLGPAADPGKIKICCEYRTPQHAEAYTQIFGDHCEFGAATTGLYFPKAWLSLPVHRGSGSLSIVYQAMCERVLGPGKTAVDAPLQVRRLLLSRSGREMPNLEQAAEALRLTPTQLRKRLYRAGTSYKSLVLETRMELASHYLVDTQLSIQEIAFLLDYATPAPFSRAFKRVFGQAPEHYRQSR